MLARNFSMLTKAFDSSTPLLSNELSATYIRKTSKHFLGVNDEKLAAKVLQQIGPKLGGKNKYIFEGSSVHGLLTKQLLQLPMVEKLRVFDNNKNELKVLKSLQEEYAGKLEIIDKQILDFVTGNYRLLDLTWEDMNTFCFDGVPIQKDWTFQMDHPLTKKLDCSIQFISVLSPLLAHEFLTHLIHAFAGHQTFFSTGPTDFYLFLPIPQYKLILCKPSNNLSEYTSFTILMNSLFDITEIDLFSPGLKGIGKVKIENKICSVINSTYFSDTKNRTINPEINYVFLNLKPKSFFQQADTDFLTDYVIFVKQSFKKRTNYVVRYYEKHFPECAPDLIGLGISYFKKFGDLTNEEMLIIFKHLYKIPHYRNSIFKEHC